MRIQAPNKNENDYVNRKGYHSINVQAVCNHKGKKGVYHFQQAFNIQMIKNKAEIIHII